MYRQKIGKEEGTTLEFINSGIAITASNIIESFNLKGTTVGFMLDIETLGLEKDGNAPLVSLALIPFNRTNIFKEASIYVRFDMKQYDNLSVKHNMSISTIVWWMSQSDEARKEFIGGDSDLYQSLDMVKDYIELWKINIEDDFGKGDVRVWAKSPDFDLTICNRWLRNLSGEDDNSIARYSKYRCVRTSMEDSRDRAVDILLYDSGMPSGANITTHNAFNDGVLQIEQLQYGWNF